MTFKALSFSSIGKSAASRSAIFGLAVLASTALAAPGWAKEFPAVIPLSSLDGTIGFRLDGVKTGDDSGWSVAGAGDVNGDGFADVIVGARFADPQGLDSGSSYVVFGKALSFAAAIDLSTLDGSNGFRLDGNGGFSGGTVASAGDVNGDAIADFEIGLLNFTDLANLTSIDFIR